MLVKCCADCAGGTISDLVSTFPSQIIQSQEKVGLLQFCLEISPKGVSNFYELQIFPFFIVPRFGGLKFFGANFKKM